MLGAVLFVGALLPCRDSVHCLLVVFVRHLGVERWHSVSLFSGEWDYIAFVFLRLGGRVLLL